MLESLDVPPCFLAVFMAAVMLLAPGESGLGGFRNYHLCFGTDWLLSCLTIRGRLVLGCRLEGSQPGHNLFVLLGELIEENLLPLEFFFEGALYLFLEDPEGVGELSGDKGIPFPL